MAAEGTTLAVSTLAGTAFAMPGRSFEQSFPWRIRRMELDELRSLTRDRLQRGELPREKCQVTWFGPGLGLPCELCRRPIRRTEIECECEHPGGGVLRFHQACFAVWDDERQQPG